MTYHYLPTFLKLLKKLSSTEKQRTQGAIDQLIDFFETGLQPKGLGLKKLKKQYWEIRVDLSLRVLSEYQKSEITFVLVGNHNDIQRILREV